MNISGFKFTHIGWPSFENIHRKFNQGDIRTDYRVCVTKKVDGCNLGVEIYDDKVVAVNSRNQTLWRYDMNGNPADIEFNKQSLAWLRTYTSAFTSLWHKYANSNKSLIIVGELFKNDFHPFGLIIRSFTHEHKTLYHMMTHSLWHQFTGLGLKPPKLVIDQPIRLTEAIHVLHDIMRHPEPGFEGVFITCEDQQQPSTGVGVIGMKYKTGMFEEQPNWRPKYDNIHTDFHSTIKLLEEVYATKHVKVRVEKVVSDEIIAIQHQVELAFNSVASKKPTIFDDFKASKGSAIGTFIKLVNALVLTDVLEQYKLTDNIPAIALIERQVNQMVPKLLNK